MVYKTPGVKIEEIRKLPPSIAAVETAIPVFIGYTQKAKEKEDDDLDKDPKRIKSMFDYERFFGTAQNETGIAVTVTTDPLGGPSDIFAKNGSPSNYLMYYSVQAFFDNGGGPCWIVSVGTYEDGEPIRVDDLKDGLAAAGKVDEITLNVFPDATNLTSSDDYYGLQKESMDQCKKLQDRFAVMDVWIDNADPGSAIDTLRNSGLGSDVDTLKYGAVYYPNLVTTYDYQYEDDGVQVITDSGTAETLTEVKGRDNALYNQIDNLIGVQVNVMLPPSAPVVGIYAQVDSSRGVWKAPANINVDGVIRPSLKITDEDQRDLNVDALAGKSVNAIRSFTGRGPAMVWGARTLAGNDNEWRYINVRRFFNMVEESTKNATFQFVFEPNDRNTWTRVKAMVSNFLTLQWRAGALMGTTPEEAYYVKIGLNETMSELDILEGRMIVEIGMAVVRPAEFIILKFSHKMLSES